MGSESVWPYMQKRFPEGQYALLQEVSDAAGFSRSRSADGIAMSLWPSRGLGIEGIEVKSFRSDWLRELKQPDKAENIFKYCDRWWLVTSDDTVAKIEEIPATWGWMTLKGKKMITMKEAPQLTPVPIGKNFVAAMMKRATKGMVPIGSIEERIKEARDEAKIEAERNMPYQLKSLREEMSDLQKRVSDFEQASGLTITGWRPRPVKMGEAVKFIEDGGMPKLHKDLINLKKTADRICKAIADGLESAKVFVGEAIEEEG
jgi:hypothetical protein